MKKSNGLKVVIASAAHRAHYVEWFKAALRSEGIYGEVIAFEYRDTAPTLSMADRGVVVPAYNSPEYRNEVVSWVRRESPDLFISVNDYELQVLAGGLAEELREGGCTVAALDADAQNIVLDKHQMAARLRDRGLPTPATWLGSETDMAKAANSDGRFIVKHRFGSGSDGVRTATDETLQAMVMESAKAARDAGGKPTTLGEDAVIIQTLLPGAEFGVDGVFSLDGTGGLNGALARRKDRMRGGDTDVATTVAANGFTQVLVELGDLLKPVGPIDVDFKEDTEGSPQVIDINPRFGGGYPFCHLAGADVPAYIVRELAGLADVRSLLDYEVGVTTARRDEFSVLRASASERPARASEEIQGHA
ncbi:ATP-grasp domain-containing protein [Brevibacterium sp. 'Marine']|uniref:ATP-grasp domain-containing protein n=1 Tax=Brevibacterium sp. 'Marine' TaxID=2725563 RepID=UPI00145E5BEC|nr:ATP-grasp domain-containing protein [Brevibacterium sp. 'Marine']